MSPLPHLRFYLEDMQTSPGLHMYYICIVSFREVEVRLLRPTAGSSPGPPALLLPAVQHVSSGMDPGSLPVAVGMLSERCSRSDPLPAHAIWAPPSGLCHVLRSRDPF